MKKSLLYILTCFFLFGCNDELPKNLQITSVALGTLNEIVVIAEDKLWDGPVGDSLRYYYESAYPILPQPEPFFDLRHFTPQQLKNEKLRRELRTYLVLSDLSDTDSGATQMTKRDLGETKFQEALNSTNKNNSIGRDKWAIGQIVVYLYANGEQNLTTAIKNTFSAIAKRIHIHDEKIVQARVYARSTNAGLSKQVLEDYGINIQIPFDYQIAIENKEDQFLWLRKDLGEVVFNFVVKKMPYTNAEDISIENIKTIRNDFGKYYVRSDQDGSYMVINDKDLPIFDYNIKIDDCYTLEARGIWEMTKDFMGGPFASYLIVSKDQKSLYFIDTFVYAPGKNKRDHMQELEHLVKSIAF